MIRIARPSVSVYSIEPTEGYTAERIAELLNKLDNEFTEIEGNVILRNGEVIATIIEVREIRELWRAMT
jgi:hypothetical protein